MSNVTRQDRQLAEYAIEAQGQYARRPAEDRPHLVIQSELLAQVRRELGRPA